MTVPPRLFSFPIVVALALCLYLPLLSKNYDLNGLAEAAAVQAGSPSDLLTPNHMLYRPAGHFVRSRVADLGWSGGIVPVLQVLSAIFGALGVGFAFLMLRRLTADAPIAFWTSLMLGVSWSYWTLSTDVYYFSMAAMFVAATMAVFVRAESAWAFAASGILAGLAILACQANVFLLPGLGAAMLVRASMDRPVHWSRTLGHLALFGGVALGVVGAVFAGVGFWVFDRRSVETLLQWGSSYTNNPLPMWGAWSFDRLVPAVGSAFKSVIGLDLWMFDFFKRRFLGPDGELPVWFAPLGAVILVATLISAYRWGPAKRDSQRRTVLWLLLAYAAYIPFILWWEPVEPRWFILPNIFLAGVAAIVWSRWSTWRYFKVALPVSFLILLGWNLAMSAGPKRFAASIPTRTAACVASHMTEADLFLAAEWNWAGYIEYVHNRKILNLVTQVTRDDKQQTLERIAKVLRARQMEGGNIYMMDIKVYTPEYMKWLEGQTGLTADDLRRYAGPRAFDCVYGEFFRLEAL